ncbi:hypothetical protein [Spongiactinospora sp. 9N601]|uniref:hypothetical protein n=1 Tax=Spongiactinospora sp. 9N601 TaxID=3375149 RepID=UPI0037A809E7
MTMQSFVTAVVIALIAAECCGLLQRAARGLIRWAVRLSHGRTPRAEIRLLEQYQNLDDCSGEIGKLLFALRWAVRGVVQQAIGPPVETCWESAEAGQIFSAVAALRTGLQSFGGDIRTHPPARRKEFDRQAARLRALLGKPCAVFDDETADVLLATTTTTCQAYVDDRNERAALDLVKAALPLMGRMGRGNRAVLGLRRAHASAVLATGDHRRAEALLRELMRDELKVFGPHDPQTIKTAQLRYWAWHSAERFDKAEAGLNSLHTRMAGMPGVETTDRQHVQCKHAWTLGTLHRVRESAALYDHVISDRAGTQGADHPDTLDARHSKGKMFVHNGDGQAARTVLLPLVADMRRVFGARHPYTLETRKYLALASALSYPLIRHEHRAAVRELRRVLRFQRHRHGPGHPLTHDTRMWLAMLTEHAEKS